MPIIKLGFCVAYDWHFLKESLRRVYECSHKICLSLDRNRRSWSGQGYDFNEKDFRELIQSIDVQKKIDIYEDDFSLQNLSSIENDNRQRMLMSKRMGPGGWHIQVDSDEYFLDFPGFVSYLLKINSNPEPTNKPINISCNWISLFKKTERGYLVVDNSASEFETMPFATNVPEYLNARRNSHFNHLSPFFVLHETWARDEVQLRRKLMSWGHDTDLRHKDSYLNFWRALDQDNFRYAHNFHPLKGEVWHKLRYIDGSEISEVITALKGSDLVKINRLKMFLKNSRNVQRFLSILKIGR